MTQEAGLLNGFAEPISSTSKIDAAASRQATLIADGSLNATDARIVEVLGDSTVVLDVSNTLGIRVSNAQGQSNLSPALKRLSQVIATTITPQVDPLDELNIFEAPGFALPSYVLPELSADDIVLGLIAGNINLIGGDWDLNTNPSWQGDVVGGREAFFLRAADTLNINNETLAIGINEVFSLSGFTQDSKVEMLGRQALFIESGSEILIDELIHSVNLSLDSHFGDIDLDDVTIYNQSGSLRIFSEEGDLTVSDSMLFAGIVGAPIFPITLVEDGLENTLELSGANVGVQDTTASAANLALFSAQDMLMVEDSVISANFIEFSAAEINSQTISYVTDDLKLHADNILSITSSDLSSVPAINLGARTLVLSDVQFSSLSTIELGSLYGLLAENPNTGASAASGFVNFTINVKVDGNTAQDYV
jgi:hypothetical protein